MFQAPAHHSPGAAVPEPSGFRDHEFHAVPYRNRAIRRLRRKAGGKPMEVLLAEFLQLRPAHDDLRLPRVEQIQFAQQSAQDVIANAILIPQLDCGLPLHFPQRPS